MNKITLIGNLTHDPEVRSTQSGITVCSFTIAVNRRRAPAGADRPVDYFRINAWRQLGDACARNLSKGRKVAIVGELQARTYEAKDGTTRMSLDVQADEVEFVSPKPQKDDSGYENQAQGAADMSAFSDISADDIPF